MQLTALSLSSPAPASDADTQLPDASSSHDSTDATAADGESSASSSTSASTASLPASQRQQQEELAQSLPNAQTLLTRLQSSLPPDLLTTLRDTIPDSVRHTPGRMDLAQVAQMGMQGAAARGEELLRGASVFLRDAVRVVPPEQAGASLTPTSSPTPPTHEGAATPRGEASTSVISAGIPATRRDALLRALRANPEILRVDPASEERSGEFFISWVKAGADAAHDETRRAAELAADDGVLANTRSALGELSLFSEDHRPMTDGGGTQCRRYCPKTTFGPDTSSAYPR
jgi:hypothetical protein